MIHAGRRTATLEGDFVVFLIGMRVNKLTHVHKWMPVGAAMPRMLKELAQQPELGFLHGESWFGRTSIMLQYWRTVDQLLAYAKGKDNHHLPAWQAFNKAVGSDGTVGVWHETYHVRAGTYENIYVNMPAFGLSAVGNVVSATGGLQSAAARMSAAQKR